jgi:hypothetical protein
MDGLETSNTGLHVITIGMQHFSCEIDITCDFVKKRTGNDVDQVE